MKRRVYNGIEHASIADTLDTLAVVHEKLGNYVEALTMYGESLEMKRKLNGTDHPSIDDTLSSMSGMHKDQVSSYHYMFVYSNHKYIFLSCIFKVCILFSCESVFLCCMMQYTMNIEYIRY